MKTNKDFRKFKDEGLRSEQAKGKAVPGKEKKSKRSIYDDFDEDEDFEYGLKRETLEDFFDDEISDFDEDFEDLIDDGEYEEYEDEY